MIVNPDESRLVCFAPIMSVILSWSVLYGYFLPGMLDPETVIDRRQLFLVASYLFFAFCTCLMFIIEPYLSLPSIVADDWWFVLIPIEIALLVHFGSLLMIPFQIYDKGTELVSVLLLLLAVFSVAYLQGVLQWQLCLLSLFLFFTV